MAAESETMSVDTSNELQEDPLQDMTDEQLSELLEEQLRNNAILSTETDMFDKYWKRLEPREYTLGGAPAPTGQPSQPEVQVPGAGRHSNRKRSKSRSSHADRMLRLTPDQKCDIAQREIEEIKEDIQKFTDDSEKVLDTHRAVMEEADMRFAEMKKAGYEFERDIVKGAVNARTQTVIAERVTRYFEDKSRARETLIGKLRLKNSTVKVQKKKLHMQLKQKEEMGEVLHEVDFNQLKIENNQYLEKIEERNSELLRLKLLATNTLQVLNSYKKKLHTLTLESDRLKAEISSRDELLSRLEAETGLVEEDRAKAEGTNKKFRQELADYHVPEVMEYVGERSDLYDLQKTVRSWERKVDIANMALQTYRRTWNKMKMDSH